MFATPDLKLSRNKLRSTNYGEIRHAATALLAAGDSATAPRVRTSLSHSIQNVRPRLDLTYPFVKSRPIEIRRSRCSLTANIPVSTWILAKESMSF